MRGGVWEVRHCWWTLGMLTLALAGGTRGAVGEVFIPGSGSGATPPGRPGRVPFSVRPPPLLRLSPDARVRTLGLALLQLYGKASPQCIRFNFDSLAHQHHCRSPEGTRSQPERGMPFTSVVSRVRRHLPHSNPARGQVHPCGSRHGCERCLEMSRRRESGRPA
jgi:hypothetical protein